MLKTTVLAASAAATLSLSLAAPASAAAPEQPCKARSGEKCRFYEFDPSSFEGTRKGPPGMRVDSEGRPEFDGLLYLKPPSFLRTLLDTSRLTIFR